MTALSEPFLSQPTPARTMGWLLRGLADHPGEPGCRAWRVTGPSLGRSGGGSNAAAMGALVAAWAHQPPCCWDADSIWGRFVLVVGRACAANAVRPAEPARSRRSPCARNQALQTNRMATELGRALQHRSQVALLGQVAELLPKDTVSCSPGAIEAPSWSCGLAPTVSTRVSMWRRFMESGSFEDVRWNLR